MGKSGPARLLAAAAILTAAAIVIYLLVIRPGAPRAGRVVRNPGANVLLITLDTTRPDRLGAYGYSKAATPEIDGLARAGALFENAYSPVPMTLPAHASILTGTTPLYHGIHLNGKHILAPEAVTLAKTLKSSGWATAAFVSSFVLDSRFGLDQGFDLYGDTMEDAGRVKNLDSERRAGTTFREFAAWMDRRAPGRFFAWVHFYDPHYPYAPPEPYRSDVRLTGPYDGEIAYVDHYVGEVKRLLEKSGLAESTLIILAGDHGEAFGEHGESDGHTIFAYQENIRVPLILWSALGFPRGLRVAGRAGLEDIFPTVLDYLKIQVPASVQGKSLLPLLSGRRAPARDFRFESDYFRDVLGCAPLRGLISGPFKFIDLPKPELYDLSKDPAEAANLAGALTHASELSKMRQRLTSLELALAGGGWARGREMSAEERRRLESLGYLSATVKAAAGPTCDPKDKIGYWNRSLEARRLLADGKFDAAESLLRSLFEEDPRFSPVIEDLGDLYFSRKKVQPLVDLFEKAIRLNPGSAGLRIVYGRFLVRLGRAAEAVPVLEAAGRLAGPDEMEHVQFTLGNAFGQLERSDEAARSFRRALELEPENFEASRLLGLVLMRSGKLEEALVHFRQAEKGMPQDPRLLEDTALSLVGLRRFEEALPYFERAVKVNPAAPVYASYAVACSETGDTKRAIELMEKAIRLPDSVPDLQSLGRRYIAGWRNKQ
jgi:arylsulfatase A-like enzyme/tetratricopeptide (TPR) repeat protein